ncbi:hypothetical protein [Nonomuraea sp. B19D2]|uniref:hypothetical protein n=1 Tax=Nonomuraea sp. B19D2 TaxID=3159561 RepID=UPI0032D9B032
MVVVLLLALMACSSGPDLPEARFESSAGPDPKTLGFAEGANPRIGCTALDRRVKGLGYEWRGGVRPTVGDSSEVRLGCGWTSATGQLPILLSVYAEEDGAERAVEEAMLGSPREAIEALDVGEGGFLAEHVEGERRALSGYFHRDGMRFEVGYGYSSKENGQKAFADVLKVLGDNSAVAPTEQDQLVALDYLDKAADVRLAAYKAGFPTLARIDPGPLNHSRCPRIDKIVRSRWKAVFKRKTQPSSAGYACSWNGTVDDRIWTFSVQVGKPPNIVDSYRRELAGIVDMMEEADETTTFSPVYAFPAGDEGFFVHETDYSRAGGKFTAPPQPLSGRAISRSPSC